MISGGMFGGQAGVQKQFGNNIVLGVEESRCGYRTLTAGLTARTQLGVCQTKVVDVFELGRRIV